MVEQSTLVTGQTTPDSTLRMDAWAQARKRADNYLKLHQLGSHDRELLLTAVANKLMRTVPTSCSEQELVQLFIGTVQTELTAQQADTAHSKTGPRFERSSIRVAPLRAITLLPRA